MAQPITLALPPGVVNKASKAKKTANWRETNLIRWDQGTLVPVGGWSRSIFGPFASTLRAIHKWQGNNGIIYYAFLCEQHLYVYYNNNFYDISPTPAIAGITLGGAGYGAQDYGEQAYGTARSGPSSIGFPAPMFTLDNWGEDLRAMASPDGRLLKWAPSAGLPPANKSSLVTGSPLGRTFVVTPERYIIIFGAGSVPNKYEWCDREDDTNWTPGLTSDAGDKNAEPASPILTAIRTKNVTLFTTLSSGYTLTWVGRPGIFSEERIGSIAVPISPKMIAETPVGAMWYSESGFWQFNGVSVQPMRCDISDWVAKNLNKARTRIFGTAIHNPSQSEVWFSFVSTASGSVPDKTAVYDYKQDIWYMLDVGRLSGYTSAHDESPLMGSQSVVYQHEDGYIYTDHSGVPWGETHTMTMMEGQRFLEIQKIMPDIQGDLSGFSFQVVQTKKIVETNEDQQVYSPERHVKSNGEVDIFRMARDIRVRFNSTPGSWSFGDWRLAAVTRGNWTPPS